MIGPSLWWRLVVTALWCVAHGRYKGNLPLRCTWNEVGGGAYRLLWSRITNVVTGLVLYISDFQSKLCSRLLCQLTVWQLYYVGHCRYIPCVITKCWYKYWIILWLDLWCFLLLWPWLCTICLLLCWNLQNHCLVMMSLTAQLKASLETNCLICWPVNAMAPQTSMYNNLLLPPSTASQFCFHGKHGNKVYLGLVLWQNKVSTIKFTVLAADSRCCTPKFWPVGAGCSGKPQRLLGAVATALISVNQRTCLSKQRH